MLKQNGLFRSHGLGSFHELLLDVTKDPAMLLWLNGSDNSKDSPNENYGREMMELFTLGAGRGYGENDVRQQARALTGFRNSWSQNSGPDQFRYDPQHHDSGVKTIFRHRGGFTWKDSCRLCVTHPDHASFFIQKLWGYFVPVAPDHATQRALEQLYVSSRLRGASGGGGNPARIPTLYGGAAPREAARSSTTPACSAGSGAGSTRPPGRGWMRWQASSSSTRRTSPDGTTRAGSTRQPGGDGGGSRSTYSIARHSIRRMLMSPTTRRNSSIAPASSGATRALEGDTRHALHTFARRALADARGESWKREQYPVMVQNALRQLIAVSPEMQAA